ncbi:MAG: MFS transporter [Pseudolysinimonas sp.]|uniref:MFS transporter n=1 Tax=Pseudolysinimonas sp. TaxID=2680009 RepID=UPI0032657484
MSDRVLPDPRWSAWRVVVGFGLVSLAVDLVADGAKSIQGPLLASLGASALVVGIVTGGAEAAGYGLRLVSGPLVDRTKRYWGFAIGGYALTALCIPLLAFTPWIGPAGVVVAATLIVVERVGKAIRSPAKTVLLAHAATAVGGGRGFGVHKLLDQVGAFSGPLIVAAVIAISGAIWPAFAILAIPGLFALAFLLWMRRRVPDPGAFSAPLLRSAQPQAAVSSSRAIPRSLYLFSLSAAFTSFGLVGFGVMSFHLTDAGLVDVAAVPLVYAVGMAAAAVAAVITGRAYDTFGGAVLLVVPVMVAAIPVLTLSSTFAWVIVGVMVWGAATGVHDSTVKALVADLVPVARRGTAYGVFAVFQGAGTFAGAVVAGALYPDAGTLSIITIPAQIASLVLLIVVVRARRRGVNRKTPPIRRENEARAGHNETEQS